MFSGLTARITGALLLVAIVTLAVTTAVLLPRLDSQIRSQELLALADNARAQRQPLAQITPADTRIPGSRAVRSIAHSLHTADGADVAIFGPSGQLLAATDPDGRGLEPSLAVRKALASGKSQHSSVDSNGEAQVVIALHGGGGRVAVELSKPLTFVNRATAIVRSSLLTAAAISLIVALLFGLWIARRMVQRLKALRDTADRAGVIGLQAELVSDDSHDEVGDLTRSMVAMQQRLRAQTSAQRDFVATASHELRTPLASLTVILEMLSEDLNAGELAKARSHAAGAAEQADRLSSLTSDLLDLSQLDAGRKLRTELVPIDEIVRSVVAEFAQGTASRGEVLASATEQPVWAIADPGAVAQVLRVLIENALTHGASAESVEVVSETAGGRAVISVTDQGPGVASADARRIFERFSRGESAQPTHGVGLGLAIASELATQMNGELLLEPRSDGATFKLLVPTVTVDGADDQ